MKTSGQKLGDLSFLIPATIAILSIFYLIEVLKLDLGTFDYPAEGFVPLIFGIFLLGGSCLLMIDAFLKPLNATDPISKNEKNAFMYLVVIIVCFVIFLPIIGFSLATFLVIVASMKIMRASFKTSILTASCTAIICTLLFRIWLNIPLPYPFFM